MDGNWCKDFCPELAIFNNLYIKREGRGLFSHLVFDGTEAGIEEVIQTEIDYFTEHDFECVIINEKDNDVEKPKTLYFHANGCNHFKVNAFDITKYQSTELFEMLDLNLSRVNKEEVYDRYLKSAYDKELFINNTLINHYSKHPDDDILRMSDMDWMEDEEKPVSKPETKKADSKDKERTVLESDKEWLDDNKEWIDDESDAAIKNLTESEKVTPEDENAVVESGTEKENTVETSQETKENASDSKNSLSDAGYEDVPEPEVIEQKKKASDYIIKEKLTQAEKDSNTQKLKELKAAYNEVIDYLKSLKNARWNTIINKMTDCVTNNVFNQQWCVLYLNLSDDTKNETYKKLYDLDKQTINFQKNIVHQVTHINCPICGSKSDEDITFLSEGIHYIECPNCYSKRAIEKK